MAIMVILLLPGSCSASTGKRSVPSQTGACGGCDGFFVAPPGIGADNARGCPRWRGGRPGNRGVARIQRGLVMRQRVQFGGLVLTAVVLAYVSGAEVKAQGDKNPAATPSPRKAKGGDTDANWM